eukprot:TRINITY_DN1391_c0_g1_i3.p3 TRINITY_DN1391_c0_g1~~TRINITY_DN1391_c0_g1_i3.p3  ORF type:complete len:170 (-),score=37.98 TRINITY_DN1391_c0_g1_i3:548-1057(-)
MIPVMVMGAVLHGKRYPLAKYLCVLAVSLGIVIFFLGKPSKHSGDASSEAGAAVLGVVPLQMAGVLLLVCALALDGTTGSLQDNVIMRSSEPPSPHQMMLWLNSVASVLLVGWLVATGDLQPALDFSIAHPSALKDMAAFALCGALGQNFIVFLVTEFGARVCCRPRRP